MLRDTEQPYPIDLNVDYGATKLTLKGTVQDPFQWTGANADLTLSGPNLSEIYPLLGIPGPPTPPYRISGKLEREPGLWKFVNTKWHVGDSDLTGDILIDETKKPQFLTAKLVSQHLAFADLAPLVGAPPGKTGNVSAQQKQTQQQLEATGDLFPNVPLHTERLRAMNMDVTLDAKKVVAPDYLPVQALAFRVLINNGVATAKPLTLSLVGGGTIAGELAIEAQTDVPKVRATLKGTNIELGMFFRNSRYFDTTKGKIQGQVALAGSGKSLAQVMSVADGHIEVALDRRIGEQPDGEPGRPADLRCADPLRDRRQPHSDPLCPGPAQLPARHRRVRPDAARYPEIDPSRHRPSRAAEPGRKSRGQGRSQVVRSPGLARPGYRRGKDPLSIHQDWPGYPDSDPRDRQRKECGVRSRREAALFRSAITLAARKSPDRTIVVGDTPYDAEAAAKAGLRTIGLLCGGYPRTN